VLFEVCEGIFITNEEININFGQERTILNWHSVQGGPEKGLHRRTHNS